MQTKTTERHRLIRHAALPVFIALAACTDSAPPGAGTPATGSTATTTGEPAGLVSQSFADLDTDGNGVLSRTETRDVPALEEIFEIADGDRSGDLSVAEFSQATIEGFRVSAEAARGPLFLELDVDENGRISDAEAEAVPQLAANFAAFDTDGNGGIDPQEYMDARDTGLTPGD